MSEGKRVSLQSIGPAKKDKKSASTSTTIRLNLTLPSCNSDTFADFNYRSLILNEKRKKEKSREKDGKVNGVGPLDPYASDDENNLRQLARSFESKYGTPKKKCRRLEDYTELGTGYDENDSFIDNTDAYDEVVPEDKVPELDGFYINKGALVLKCVDGRSSSDKSDSDSSEGPQNPKSAKRRLSSESGSSSSGSGSDDSSDSDSSDDSEDDDEENEEAEVETEDNSKIIKDTPKERKDENGHATSPVVKKLKLSEPVPKEVSSKKTKSKAITDLFMKKAVSEKEHNEKRLKLDSEGESKRISSIDAAIEAVARGDDSKESGIAESKSHSGSSEDSEPEEVHSGVKVNGQTNGLSAISRPLPDDLPENVLAVVTALKEVAVQNANLGKQQFFTSDVNTLLLRFEKLMRTVPRDKKNGVYDYLECFLPCRKETLIKRGRVLLFENVEAGYKEPLQKLKAGILTLMPNAMDRYLAMCKKYESCTELSSDGQKISPEKTKIPRRRFPWTEELKNLLCLAVKKRRVYFGTVKQKGETWDENLKEFLKNDVLPMWENGWMKIASLMDIIAKMAPDLLLFKPMSPALKLKKNPVGPHVKKQCPKVTNIASPQSSQLLDAQTADVNAFKKTVPSTNSSVLSSKTGQSISCQNQNKAPSSDYGTKKAQPLHNGAQTTPIVPSVKSVQPNLLPTVSQSSSMDILVENIRTSLANSLVSVTPVQNNSFSVSQTSHIDHSDSVSKSRSVPSSSSVRKPSASGSHLQTNGLDSSGLEIFPKKRSPVPNNPTQSYKNNPSSVQSFNMESQDLSKHQSGSTLSSNIASSHASHVMQTPRQSSSPQNTIKVSSVSAINLKLSGSQSQTSSQPPQSSQTQAATSKTNSSHSLKAHNHQGVPAPISPHHPAAVNFSSPSVISHGLESSGLGVSSSVTITPVKPGLNNNSYYQQAKMSGHQQVSSSHSSLQSFQSNNSSLASHGSSNVRSEVIVTPSSNSSMPHIKSTNVNYGVSSANNVSSSNNYSSLQSSGNNFSSSHSASGNNFSSSRGASGNNYSSSHGASGNGFSSTLTSSENLSVRTHRTMVNQSEPQVSKNQSSDKVSFSHPSQSQVPEKNLYMPSMWSTPAPVETPRSSASLSPSSVKSVTPSPEKALVSRKDRILQDSRERGGNEPVMPTLSGPYRSSSNTSEQSNIMRNQPQSGHNLKRKSLSEISELDIDILSATLPSTSSSLRGDPKALMNQGDSKAQELAMRGILMSRTNCDVNYADEPWGAPTKKTVSNKPSNDMSDQRLSGMGGLSSSLSMTGLDGMSLGLPSHLVGYQNDYQRHLYGSSSKPTGPNDHRPL